MRVSSVFIRFLVRWHHAHCTCPIYSTALVNRFCINSIRASKCSIGLARIYTSSKETQKVYRLVLESKLLHNTNKEIYFTNAFKWSSSHGFILSCRIFAVVNLVSGWMEIWIKADRSVVAHTPMSRWPRKRTLLSKHSNVGHLFKADHIYT